MSVSFPPMGGFIGFGLGHYAASALGVGEPVSWFVGGVVAALALAAWVYSPLPDTNGGMMAHDPNTSWGWSGRDE